MLTRKQQTSLLKLMGSFMALLMLVSQTSIVFASMDRFASQHSGSTSLEMVKCLHDDVSRNSFDRYTQNDGMKSCQQNCCESQDCVNHCQSCVSVVFGALMPVLLSVHSRHRSQIILVKSDQSPSSSNPSQLYRPPRYLA